MLYLYALAAIGCTPSDRPNWVPEVLRDESRFEIRYDDLDGFSVRRLADNATIFIDVNTSEPKYSERPMIGSVLRELPRTPPSGLPIGRQFKQVDGLGFMKLSCIAPYELCEVSFYAPRMPKGSPAPFRPDDYREDAPFAEELLRFSLASYASRRLKTPGKAPTMLSVADWAKGRGATLEWKGKTTAHLKATGHEYVFLLASDQYKVDGVWHAMEDMAMLKNGRMLVPANALPRP